MHSSSPHFHLVPRGPMSRSVPRYNGPSGPLTPVSIQRQSWGSQNQASQRRNSNYDFRPQSITSSRAVELNSAARPTHVEVSRQ